MFVRWLVSFLALALGARGQDSVATECPAPNGFFADSRQCDKYYHCVDNILTEKLCSDGMAFDDINPTIEKCDLLAVVNCNDRPNLQPAHPTENCGRQNGNFAPSEPNCQQAWRCVEGTSTLITCPEGLAFSLETGICDWPDQSGRLDCVIEKTKNFTCPKVDLVVAVSHPRYADPADCQYFYVCINGKTPRRNGCAFGQVFSTNTSTCVVPQEVPECNDYYTEFFDDYFAKLKLNPSKADTNTIAAALAAGYDVPRFRDRIRIQQGGRITPKTEAPSRRPPSSPLADQPSTRIGSRPSRPAGQGERPLRRRRPGQGQGQGQGGLRRRKRPRTTSTTTTTTTTTTTAAPEYYDDYYYYDEYYDDTAADTMVHENGGDSIPSTTKQDPVTTDSSPPADQAPSPTTDTRTSLPVRPPRLSRTTV